MQRFIPSKVFKTRPQDPIWWTPECSAAVDRKRNAWRKFRDDPRNGALQCTYKLASLDSTRCLARAKARHLDHVKQRLRTGSLQDREWWSVIKRVGGHGRDSSIPVLVDPDGMECTKSHDKANVIGKYFAQKCSLDDDFAEQSGPFPHVRQRTANTLATVHFRQATVRRTLRALNPSKATGPDAVPARVLRKCADSLALPLSKLFTLCFCSGHQPAMWKVANVVPVHKKGPKSNPRNYRPISLLPIMSKCMESIVNRSLSNFLKKNDILSHRQFGFRTGLGTSDLLIALQHEWSLAAASGGLVRVLAVDIAGAFDKVSHNGVLHKAERCGISGLLLAWLRSYLTDRHIRVVIGGQSSPTHRIQSGVPQGSILGPTLFLLYVNDAEDHLPDGAKLAVYADDTTLYKCITTRLRLPEETAILQQAVDSLAAWGSRWRIKFEPTKSQALTISHHRSPTPPNAIRFQGAVVPEVEELKLLGVTFDRQLAFRSHIRQLAVRGAQRLGFLRKASAVLDPNKAPGNRVPWLCPPCARVWHAGVDERSPHHLGPPHCHPAPCATRITPPEPGHSTYHSRALLPADLQLQATHCGGSGNGESHSATISSRTATPHAYSSDNQICNTSSIATHQYPSPSGTKQHAPLISPLPHRNVESAPTYPSAVSPFSQRHAHVQEKRQRPLAAQQVGVGHRQAMISPSQPTHQPNYTDRTPAPFYPSLIPFAQP
eukprot:scpid34343/ scgid6119/ RNA-directed DNA polymerase from mobile element jockey; Reverse transcriptase